MQGGKRLISSECAIAWVGWFDVSNHSLGSNSKLVGDYGLFLQHCSVCQIVANLATPDPEIARTLRPEAMLAMIQLCVDDYFRVMQTECREEVVVGHTRWI